MSESESSQSEEARLAAELLSRHDFATLGTVTELATNNILNLNDDALE